jgi:hypothetical protein
MAIVQRFVILRVTLRGLFAGAIIRAEQHQRTSREVRKKRTKKPTVYVIAGPNGAGKTTFSASFLPDFVRCREFLNADLIAAGLSPFAPETQNIRAGSVTRTARGAGRPASRLRL